MPDTVLAQIPHGQPIDLFLAVGALIDAAINGAHLAQGNGTDVASTIVAHDRDTREIVTLLRAAARRIGKRDHRTTEDDDPGAVDDLGVGAFRRTDTGPTVGLTGATAAESAHEMAKVFATAFIPAMDEMGAENYLSWDVLDPETGRKYWLCAGRPGGKTPHEKRQEAEAEVAALRAQLAAAPVGEEQTA